MPAINDGVFAIDKPGAMSSAQVIRDVQGHLKTSNLFKPWFEAERNRRDMESHNQQRKRKSWKSRQPLQVKMGHGGTLDPMATGVLILGVGNGTKDLSRFLECTKGYEAILLFGAATDTYDAEGKIVARKPYEHVTKSMVEEALDRFRGKIMQRPPVYSALRMGGKRLYDYAREGKELPKEIQERPVEVEQLELSEWLEGGTHEWHWPTSETEEEEKEAAQGVLSSKDAPASASTEAQVHLEHVAKRARTGPTAEAVPERNETDEAHTGIPIKTAATEVATTASRPPCPAPACRIRMTVTSGFYVRSLCHDLGIAVGSHAIMTSLSRTRQGDFALGDNVLSYDDMKAEETVWASKLEQMLESWQTKNGRSPTRPTSKDESSAGARRNSSSADE